MHPRRPTVNVEILAHPKVKAALNRLFDLARSDTGQSARAANFLLAWWDGGEWGHFAITDLFGVDRDVAADMAVIFEFLGQHGGAIYVNAFGDQYRDQMADLVARWRPE
ncbi:MAG: hypothetical protein CVT74_14060 [Alphaproteobacteria bacterium HGW-Alphaproteobacteria-13]|nr:MAG: hypothetical protein CVT74_14060 [Alphaproteobacteria bacterium HGW-Alphaproteobacteria-13]